MTDEIDLIAEIVNFIVFHALVCFITSPRTNWYSFRKIQTRCLESDGGHHQIEPSFFCREAQKTAISSPVYSKPYTVYRLALGIGKKLQYNSPQDFSPGKDVLDGKKYTVIYTVAPRWCPRSNSSSSPSSKTLQSSVSRDPPVMWLKFEHIKGLVFDI